MEEDRRPEYYEDEIDLMEILSVLWRRKWLIVSIVAIAMVSAVGWSLFNAHDCTEALIQLNFSGIEKHKYPDGGQFDMHDIISPEILVKAANVIEDKTHREMFTNKSRGFVFIDPFIPIEVREKTQEAEKEKKTYIYLPNQFYLRFIQPVSGGVFSPEERKQVLLYVIKTYKNRFVEQYVKQKLLAVDSLKNPLSTRDYTDTVSTLNSNIQEYSGFLEDRIKEAGYYRSVKTGKSFVDIKESLKTLKSIDLKEVNSIITISHLTRFRDNLIQKYQYRIKEIEKQRKKKEGEARIAQKLLQDVWQRGEKGVSLNMQAQKGTSPFVMMDSSILEKLSEKEYISFLLKRILEADVTAKNLEVDKFDLEERLAAIKDTNTQDENSDANAKYIEQRLEEIRSNIIRLARDANELNTEYLQNKYSDVVQILKYPYSFISYDKNPRKVAGLSFIVSLILAIFIAFFVEYISNARGKMKGERLGIKD